MATTPNGKKMTREEKKTADAAARFTERVNEFKRGFFKDRDRRTYSDHAAWAARESDDRTGLALYSLIHSYTDARNRLVREMRSAVEALTEGITRVEDNSGNGAFYFSNGIVGRNGVDIDQFNTKFETLHKAIAEVANATNWRVTEIESAQEKAFADSCEMLSVMATGGGFAIRKLDGEMATWFCPGELTKPLEAFGPEGFTYATEELAWASLACIVTGRVI